MIDRKVKEVSKLQTIPLVLVDDEDMKRRGEKRGKRNKGKEVLTKKSSKEKEDLTEKLGLKGKKFIEVKKTIRIPVHYDVTKNKMDILNNLTARITYGIRLISEVVYDLVKDVEGTDAELQFLKLNVIEEIVYNTDIVEKTGLQSTYIQQCINKVIFSYKSYKELHKKWEGKVERAEERLDSARDDKERVRGEVWLEKLMNREPSKPDFRDKTSCRLDWRTGVVEQSKEKGKFPLWIHISTLEKGKTVDIPLNPSVYHLNQLKDVVVDDFEIIKGGNSRKKKSKGKYYIHISITKVIEEKSINSVGGIDQGLNKSIAAVLIGVQEQLKLSDGKDLTFPREEQLLDSAKVELLEKYDEIVASLQEAEKWDKLRQMRGKRENVSIYHDWCLANKVADFTEGSYVAIGNSNFRQSQYRGNRMVGLRKRVGKWSYSRQRKFIDLKRSETGYRTELRDEYGTSRECCLCHSKLTRRVWEDGFSYILCHDCGTKKDADLNAGYVIATRCRDDMLKAGMIRMENPVSRQDGSCPPLVCRQAGRSSQLKLIAGGSSSHVIIHR
jgi:putative transposase